MPFAKRTEAKQLNNQKNISLNLTDLSGFGQSRCRQNAGHQKRGGLNNIPYVPAHVRLSVHILPVQIPQAVVQVLAGGEGGAQAPDFQIGAEVFPQRVLIPPVIHQRIGIVFIVGIGERVRQIVGELSQCVILPAGPSLFPVLETTDAQGDVLVGICIIMSAKLIAADGALQIGEGIAVRLKGAEQESKLKTSALKTVLSLKQPGKRESLKKV